MNKRRALYGLYGITDSTLHPDTTRLLAAVAQAIKGGLSILQYRNKLADSMQKYEQAKALRTLCSASGVTFIINDDPELALAVNADGVHVGKDDTRLLSIREKFGNHLIMGCSCYNDIERARLAERDGADYVAFGRFYPSKTKPNAVKATPLLLRRAHEQLNIPICAIGGIVPENAAALIKSGADMVAVIHGLFAAADIHQQAHDFNRLFI
ncbi:MAG: thiamine phosphate synthase [Gammaproteobacteria bacterium]|nr:thiamine phosphate synthase [Gammaproteobacteria bacterium]